MAYENVSKQKINMNSSEFVALHDYVLVRPEEGSNEEKTDSGIVFAINQNQGTTDRPSSGVVISHGEETKFTDVDNFVLWPKTDGIDFEFTDGYFILLREKSIIGKKIKG